MGTQKTIPKQSKQEPIERRVLIAYYLTLASFFVASFFPDARLWGINWWSYFPLWGKLTFLLISGLLPLLAIRGKKVIEDPQWDISDRTFWVIASCSLLGMGVLFYFLRAQTHFLGDGYTLIGIIGSDQPFVKPRNLGGMGLQLLLQRFTGGPSKENALLSYRIVSIGAGMLFLAVLFASARRLIQRNIDRVLFALSGAAGGHMLLNFGYVENYALFVVSVAAFTLAGLMVSTDRLNRYWLLPLVIVSAALHIFGLVLIAPTIYLFAANSKVVAKLERLSSGAKSALIILVLTGGLIALVIASNVSLFFRFAIVPVMQTSFSIKGYTLFSPNHLLDLFNLGLLLFPGVFVALMSMRTHQTRAVLRQRQYRFLIILALACSLVALIFDPKLGMSRDWDLFSLSGIPIVLGISYLLLSSSTRGTSTRLAVVLSIGLGLLALVSRAIILAVPSMGVQQYRAYIDLDRERNRAGSTNLVNYYLSVGDSASARSFDSVRQDLYIEERLMKLAKTSYDHRDFSQMNVLVRQAISASPQYSEAWLGLARYFVATGQCDSGVFAAQIADGLNPYNPAVMNTLGNGYLCLGDLDRAESTFGKAIEIDSTSYMPFHQLALVYQRKQDEPQYVENLTKAVTRPRPQASGFKELCAYYSRRGDLDSVSKWLTYGLSHGLDSAYADSVYRVHPEVRR